VEVWSQPALARADIGPRHSEPQHHLQASSSPDPTTKSHILPRNLVGSIQHIFLLDTIPWKPTHLDTYTPKSPPHPQISDKLAHHETRRVCCECMDMVCVILLKLPCVYTDFANSLPALSCLCSQSLFYPSSAPYSRYDTYYAAIEPPLPSDIFTTSNHATTT